MTWETATMVPTSITGWTNPAAGATISKDTLSVSITATISSMVTLWPDATAHFTRLASVMVSPSFGTVISVAMVASIG
jgi:hypothetical protein